MIRKCTECGKEFNCSPSDKIVTCGKECSRKRRSRLLMGHKQSKETSKKISEAAKGRDMSKIQDLGTSAAMKSPKSGKFVTNYSAKRWILLSPDKEIYDCVNLAEFVRTHADLFDIEPTDENVYRVCHGFFTIKKNLKRKKGTITYKDWTLLSWFDETNYQILKNAAEDK